MFSILIPFQGGNAHREKIFNWLVGFYEKNVPEAEIVIGEDYTGRINRSRMRNDAFNKSTRDILVYIDADGLIRPEDIREAVKRVRRGTAMVQAETVTWITKESTATILDGPTDWPPIEKKDIQAVERVLGEFFVLSRETFEKVRGWDERFEGWGGEDQVFRCAIMALVGKIEKLPSTIYHLWHPRTVNECPKHSGFKVNKVLRDRYVAYQGNSRAMESLISERFADSRVSIDFYAQAAHYFDHLETICKAMPDYLRGKFYVLSQIGAHSRSKKIRTYLMPSHLKVVQSLRKGTGPVVVAGIEDAKTAYAAGRIPFLVDHGVGQTYIDSTHPSYARGKGRDFVGLFIVPNEWCERENKKGCPEVPTAIVGCPKLDPWHNRPAKKRNNSPVVCVSFHWDCSISVETRGAFDYFKDILPELAKSTEFELVGHAHPRLAKIAYPFYHKHGIRILKTFDDVLNEADVYITDNSSTLYEFADLDRPVVVLNPPWFRRDIHHGLRFWECADVGVQCERPEDLKEAILKAIEDPQEIADRRREIMCDVYPFKGNSSQLAVQAIEKRWKELFERRGEEVKVRIERPFLHDGRIVKSGEIVDMGNQKAQNLEKKKLVTFIPEIKVPSENKMITPPENKLLDSIEEKDPDGRGYVCQICDRGFYTLSGLKSHIRAAHPGAPYPKD